MVKSVVPFLCLALSLITVSCLSTRLSAHASTAMPTSGDSLVCPAAGPGVPETAADCPWAGVARLLNDAADRQLDLLPILDTYLPRFLKDLRSDASREELKPLWGRSINYDELAHGIIVNPAILQTFSRELGVPLPDGRIVHAGMEHTYGYLFSILQTAYGYKRARWVQSDIADGFGLPRDTLSPTPAEGTLLTNVTTFAGLIAIQDDPQAVKALAQIKTAASPLLRDFPYDRLRPIRLEEILDTVVLRTDLVPFFTMPASADANSHLLIYSVADRRTGRSTLVTAFPVATSFVQFVLDPKNLGEQKPIITRYNGYVDGVTGQTQSGTRRIAH